MTGTWRRPMSRDIIAWGAGSLHISTFCTALVDSGLILMICGICITCCVWILIWWDAGHCKCLQLWSMFIALLLVFVFILIIFMIIGTCIKKPESMTHQSDFWTHAQSSKLTYGQSQKLLKNTWLMTCIAAKRRVTYLELTTLIECSQWLAIWSRSWTSTAS